MPSTITATFSNATAATAGYGSWDRIIFSAGSVWTAGKTWTIAGTSSEGSFTFGIGFLGADHTVSNYLSALTFGKRVYLGQKSQFAYSSIVDPSLQNLIGFNQQSSGAGFQIVQSIQGQQDVVNGLGIFQGRLAVFGRYNIQLWNIGADPASFSLVQTLSNMGTASGFSVNGSLGDLDLLFLDDSGVRSLRTLVTTLNATIFDVGSAVDSLIQQALVSATRSAVWSAVEPLSKRYWLAIGQTIYVLSYFPQAKIQAWAQYECKDSNGTAFTPQWFGIGAGQLFMRGGSAIYVYGDFLGMNQNTYVYDSTQVTVTTPWLDHKQPKTRKSSVSIGAAFAGLWTLQAGMQPSTGTLRTVISQGSNSAPSETVDSALDLAPFPFSDDGTHIQISATTTTPGTFANPVKFSLLEWIYNTAQSE